MKKTKIQSGFFFGVVVFYIAECSFAFAERTDFQSIPFNQTYIQGDLSVVQGNDKIVSEYTTANSAVIEEGENLTISSSHIDLAGTAGDQWKINVRQTNQRDIIQSSGIYRVDSSGYVWQGNQRVYLDETNPNTVLGSSITIGQMGGYADPVKSGYFAMSGGNVSVSDSEIYAEHFDIQAGTIYLSKSDIIDFSSDMHVYGGNITLNEGSTLVTNQIFIYSDKSRLTVSGTDPAGDGDPSGSMPWFNNSYIQAYNKFHLLEGANLTLSDGGFINVGSIGSQTDEIIIEGDIIMENDSMIHGIVDDSSPEGFFAPLHIQKTGTLTVAENIRAMISAKETFVENGGKMIVSGTLDLIENRGVSNLPSSLFIRENGMLTLNEAGKVNGNVFIQENGVVSLGTNHAFISTVHFNPGSSLLLTVDGKESSSYGVLSAASFQISSQARLSVTLTAKALEELEPFKKYQMAFFTGMEAGENNFQTSVSNNLYLFQDEDKDGIYDVSFYQSLDKVIKSAKGTVNNERTSAAWLESGVFPVGSFQENIADNLSSLAQHNSKGFTNALSSLAPTAVPLVALMNTRGMETVANLVGRRTEKQPDLNTGLSSGEDNKKADIQIWAEGIYSQSRLNGQTLLKTHTRGATVGTDIRFGSFITGAGYLHSGTRAKTTLRRTHIKTQGIFFYSSYQPNNFFADFILGGQQGDYKEEKIYALKADYKAKTIWGQASAGYLFQTPCGLFTPQAGIRINRLKREAYSDTAGQFVKKEKSDETTAIGSLSYKNEIRLKKGILLTPKARLAFSYDIKRENGSSSVFLTNGASYLIEEEKLSKFQTSFSLQADFQAGNAVLNFGYGADFRKHYQNHSFFAGISYLF